LNVLLGEDHNNKRLAYLSQKGFIRHCLDAFNQENDMTALLISTEDGKHKPHLPAISHMFSV